MPLTLLLDLDDTLIDTNMADFIPAYFGALSKHLERWVHPADMLPAIMSATQLMLDNVDPSLTLQQVFDSDFFPRIGVEKERIQDALDDFYESAFRKLATVTRQRPGAKELVDWATAQGARVAIATDPLFPRKAVHERIRWAGLDPERFELISSYETFHFTKSHPAYYAEILGRMGWPDGPVLMVGNDEERDLARAQELGLRTYQVDRVAAPVSARPTPPVQESPAIGRGSLGDLREWLKSTDSATLEPAFHQQRAISAILQSTPAVLQGLVQVLSPQQWRHEPTPDDWSVIEIVCHLRDTESEVHHNQLRTLLEEPQPFVPRPDAAVWAKQRNYLDESGEQALTSFAQARDDTLHSLQGVDEAVWQRPARHAIFGPTDFLEVIGFMADHDRLHIQQAWRTLMAPS